MPRKPASQSPITSETMAYLHCWRKANELGEFIIPCKTRSEAERIKFLLYRVVKQLLAQPQMEAEFPQFMRARRNCSCRAEPTSADAPCVNTEEFPWQVCIYRSDRRREVKSLIERLGLGAEDLEIPQPESEKQLLAGLNARLQLPHVATSAAQCEQPGTFTAGQDNDQLPAGMAAYFEREES